MSEAKQIAVRARLELSITEAAHASFRQECIDAAIELAKQGEADNAYRKLLMVVAIDGVRASVLLRTNDEVIEEGAALARGEPEPN